MKLLSLIMTVFVANVIGNAVARSKGTKMPSQPIKLYYLPPSPPCRAVLMTARALNLELDLVLTNIMEGQHKTPEYTKLNPQQTIPTMDDSGFILWESRAIMAYLVNAYGKDDSLYPKNPRQRAVVDQRLHFDIGTLVPRYSALYTIVVDVFPIRCSPFTTVISSIARGCHKTDDMTIFMAPMFFQGEPYNDEAAAKLNDALKMLSAMLEGRAFVAGDDLTLADISIIVTISNLEALQFDFSVHENVAKWFERTKKTLAPYGYEEIDKAGARMLAGFLKKS